MLVGVLTPGWVAVRVAVGGTAVAVGGTVAAVRVEVAVGGWNGVSVAVGVLVGGAAGWSFGSPGKVKAMISCRLVKPSPSESAFSINPKAAGLRPAAL